MSNSVLLGAELHYSNETDWDYVVNLLKDDGFFDDDDIQALDHKNLILKIEGSNYWNFNRENDILFYAKKGYLTSQSDEELSVLVWIDGIRVDVYKTKDLQKHVTEQIQKDVFGMGWEKYKSIYDEDDRDSTLELAMETVTENVMKKVKQDIFDKTGILPNYN